METVDDQHLNAFSSPFSQPPSPAPAPERQGHTSDRPGHTPERQGHTPDRPGHTPDRPGHTSDRQGHTPDRPGYASDKPGHTSDRPGSISDTADRLAFQLSSNRPRSSSPFRSPPSYSSSSLSETKECSSLLEAKEHSSRSATPSSSPSLSIAHIHTLSSHSPESLTTPLHPPPPPQSHQPLFISLPLSLPHSQLSHSPLRFSPQNKQLIRSSRNILSTLFPTLSPSLSPDCVFDSSELYLKGLGSTKSTSMAINLNIAINADADADADTKFPDVVYSDTVALNPSPHFPHSFSSSNSHLRANSPSHHNSRPTSPCPSTSPYSNSSSAISPSLVLASFPLPSSSRLTSPRRSSRPSSPRPSSPHHSSRPSSPLPSSSRPSSPSINKISSISNPSSTPSSQIKIIFPFPSSSPSHSPRSNYINQAPPPPPPPPLFNFHSTDHSNCNFQSDFHCHSQYDVGMNSRKYSSSNSESNTVFNSKNFYEKEKERGGNEEEILREKNRGKNKEQGIEEQANEHSLEKPPSLYGLSYFLELEDFGDDDNDDEKNNCSYNNNRMNNKHYIDNHYIMNNNINNSNQINNHKYFHNNSDKIHNDFKNEDPGSLNSRYLGECDTELESQSVLKNSKIDDKNYLDFSIKNYVTNDNYYNYGDSDKNGIYNNNCKYNNNNDIDDQNKFMNCDKIDCVTIVKSEGGNNNNYDNYDNKLFNDRYSDKGNRNDKNYDYYNNNDNNVNEIKNNNTDNKNHDNNNDKNRNDNKSNDHNNYDNNDDDDDNYDENNNNDDYSDDYNDSKNSKYDEEDTNNYLSYDIYMQRRSSIITTCENQLLNPPKYSSLPPSPPSSPSSASSNSSSSSTTSFTTSYSSSCSTKSSSSSISSVNKSQNTSNSKNSNNPKKLDEKKIIKENDILILINEENHLIRNKIVVQGSNFLPSKHLGFYNRDKNDVEERRKNNNNNDRANEILHENENENEKKNYSNYIDFQIILTEADFTILEQRKAVLNRVLRYNDNNYDNNDDN